MNATFHFYQRADKLDKRNTAPIYLRVTYQRKISLFNSGIKVNPSDWNPDKEVVRRSHPSTQVFNHRLDSLKLRAQELGFEMLENESLSAKALTQALKGKAPTNFFEYCEYYLQRIKEDGLVRRFKQTKVMMNKVRAFHRSSNLDLQEINSQFLDELKRYQLNKLNNVSTTVRKDFAKMKLMFDDAMNRGLIDVSPFDRYTMPRVQKSKKEALSIDQIRSIEKLELVKDSMQYHVRNYFLFSFYNAGIRFGDLSKLTWENIVDGRLKYQMSKTARNRDPKWKNIKLSDRSYEILSEYRKSGLETDFIFPILNSDKDLDDPETFDADKGSKNTMTNKALKKIAKKAGICTNLSFHMARHSFARHAASMGMNIFAISNALAHSDLKTTQVYLKSFDEELLDNEMDTLFN